MKTDTPNFWPFPVLPEEQLTEEHRKEIRFLEAAYREGFRPCMHLVGVPEYQACSGLGREGWIIFRGRLRQSGPHGWEIGLDNQYTRVAAYWVDDFDAAAASVMTWLAGGDAHDIVAAAKPHIIRGPQVIEPATG